MTDVDDLAVVVRRAWRETLGTQGDQGSWEEMGGDSLATLHLAYRLEQLLSRTVPLELLRPEMTATQLVGALGESASAVALGDAPPVFLLPGLLGDGPSLVRFRRRLEGHIRFEVVAIADADLAARTLGDIAATACQVAATIAARQPEGPVCIAGYSFGGSVALAVAAELLDTGRDVAHVAVFDTAFGDALLGLPRPPLRRRLRRLGGRALSRLLAWDGGRRRMLTALDRLAPRSALAVRHFVLRRFRTDARLRWHPRPVNVPIFVALSDEFAPFAGPVWRRLYPHAKVTPVAATHFGLLEGEALEIVAAAFANFVADHARSGAATGGAQGQGLTWAAG